MLIPFKEMFPRHGIDDVTGIMHVGAHHAQELEAYAELGIEQVLWVEADPVTFEEMRKIIGHVPHRSACAVVSEKRGEKVTFHRASNGQSSSLLELGTHEQEHPEVKFVDSFTAITSTIDDIASTQACSTAPYSMGSPNPRVFGRRWDINMLNLDIQGAELMALKGATYMLENHIKYIYTEVNEKPLYKGCALLPELDGWLGERGFKRVETEMTRHGWGDALYIKEESA